MLRCAERVAAALVAAWAGQFGLASHLAAGVGDRSPSERSNYVDEVTGGTVTRLTASPAADNKIYQTHPNWTADGSHLIFHADRTGRDELFAMEEATGEIIQLTHGDCGAIAVARRANGIYLVCDRQVFLLDLNALLADSKAGAVDAAAYRRRIAELPDACNLSGTFSEDASGEILYFGLVDDLSRHSISKLDLGSGQFSIVVEPELRVGHCQAHPTRPGVISYCHETGGDAPQRMWIVNSDGSNNGPFYLETYDEWVTHEVWWTDDRMLFTIWPKDEAAKLKPYGIASVSLRDHSHRIHDQYPYWHVCGTEDGRYAIGDTFDGELFLIDVEAGERRLLTQGHRPRGARNHPHPSLSPDGRRVLFVSTQFGNWDLMTVEVPPTR